MIDDESEFVQVCNGIWNSDSAVPPKVFDRVERQQFAQIIVPIASSFRIIRCSKRRVGAGIGGRRCRRFLLRAARCKTNRDVISKRVKPNTTDESSRIDRSSNTHTHTCVPVKGPRVCQRMRNRFLTHRCSMTFQQQRQHSGFSGKKGKVFFTDRSRFATHTESRLSLFESHKSCRENCESYYCNQRVGMHCVSLVFRLSRRNETSFVESWRFWFFLWPRCFVSCRRFWSTAFTAACHCVDSTTCPSCILLRRRSWFRLFVRRTFCFERCRFFVFFFRLLSIGSDWRCCFSAPVSLRKMGNMFAKLFAGFGKKDMRILMVGLDAAGTNSLRFCGFFVEAADVFATSLLFPLFLLVKSKTKT